MTDLEKLLAEATPGPWRICEATIHGRKYGGCWVEGPEVDDGDGGTSGMLIPMSGSGGSTSYTTRVVDVQGHDYNDANARLIALAPSLAAALLVAEKALRDIDDRIEKAASCHHNADEWDDRTLDGDLTIMDWVMSPVRAALSEIAKLTGGGE